jgi:peptidoglycan/LPS O-acetylase OafA/YrhL
MPQLDGLRCFAVLGVLPVHFTTGGLVSYVRTGHLGVKLFFVLSGYLITSILLDYRHKVDAGEVTLLRALGVFYARRFLRLSPVYYAYLVAALVYLPGFLHYSLWYGLYLQNFLFAVRPQVFSLYLAHFWTLAIEEQFYLFASVAFLILPTKHFRLFAAGAVGLAVVVRAVGLAAGFTAHQVEMMMPSQVDTLGMGALMATLQFQKGGQAVDRLARTGLILGSPAVVAFTLMYALSVRASWVFVFEDLALAFLFTWLVWRAAKGFAGPVGKILGFAPVVFIGRISYGIYVYHFNVPGLLREKLFPKLALPWPSGRFFTFILLSLASIVVAAGSWYSYESLFSAIKPQLRRRSAGQSRSSSGTAPAGGRQGRAARE